MVSITHCGICYNIQRWKKLTFSISAFQEDYAQLEHHYEMKKLLWEPNVKIPVYIHRYIVGPIEETKNREYFVRIYNLGKSQT